MSCVITGVMKSKNRITGYTVEDETLNTREITKEQAVEWINRGIISNASVQVYNGTTIVRLKNKNVPVTATNVQVYTGKEAVDFLKKLEKGIPLKIVIVEATQAIYLGIKEDRFMFFDNSGITGICGFSSKYLINNPGKVKFITNDNDPLAVTELINIIKNRK